MGLMHSAMIDEEFHRSANLIEAVLWVGFSVCCVFAAGKVKDRRRQILWMLAVAFLAFGVSDVVESQTGSWWEPLWLLGWKLSCVAKLLFGGVKYFKLSKKHGALAAPR
jgi:hypothetical protein